MNEWLNGLVSATAQCRLTWVRPEGVQVQCLLGAVETLSHALLRKILTNVEHNITIHPNRQLIQFINRRALHRICSGGLPLRVPSPQVSGPTAGRLEGRSRSYGPPPEGEHVAR